MNRRIPLVRDTAVDLFNLEVDLGGAPSSHVAADIRIARGPLASVIDVHTSYSVVERTRARARQARADNFLVYLVRQGGTSFRNASGQKFITTRDSVVVGSQDAAYAATAAPGQPWKFRALSVPQNMLSGAGPAVRQAGFQAVSAQAPLAGILASYVDHLCDDLPSLDDAATIASIKALDQLLAASLGAPVEPRPELVQALARERWRAAMDHMAAHLGSPGLSPASIAAHLCISPRQLQRVFESTGHSVAAEMKRLRVERARALLHNFPAMLVTDVALACGFDSLATFYRCFKSEQGVTATEWRDSGTH